MFRIFRFFLQLYLGEREIYFGKISGISGNIFRRFYEIFVARPRGMRELESFCRLKMCLEIR